MGSNTEESLSFGRELRQRRQEQHLSLAALAERVHYSKSHLSKVETGDKTPSVALARRCDAALSANGGLSRLVAAPSVPPIRPNVSTVDEELVMTFGADGRNQIGVVRRREVLAAGASAAVMWTLRPAPAASGVGGETVHAVQEVLSALRLLGQTTSPTTLAPVVAAQTHAVKSLAAGAASPTTRAQLLITAVHFANYAGWLAQESGDAGAAVDWTNRAATMADAAGDLELVGYSFVRRALVAMNLPDPLETVALAQHASTVTASPRVRGLAAQREAQGHALAGSEYECLSALDRAASLLDGVDAPAGTPTIGTSTVVDSASMVRGWCLHDLGRPREAAAVLERGLAQIPESAPRSRARFGVRLALALASMRELEHAQAVLAPMWRVITDTDSATTRIDLARLSYTVGRWHDDSGVQALQRQLMTVLHTGR